MVGGSGLVGFLIWRRTYLSRPIDPAAILPLFLLTVAALEVHMTEGRRVPSAGFVAWFIFIGPGVAAFTHFIFPLPPPAVEPTLAADVAGLPNYWIGATGRYYFPGLHTAVLPMIPGIWAIRLLALGGGDR